MILATDVHYPKTGGAVAAGILFENWESEHEHDRHCVRVEDVNPYEPGLFFKRELPCLLKLLEEITFLPDLILVDGYVILGSGASDGLGMHLHNALGEKVPVVGIAKSQFEGTPIHTEVFRGKSRLPLYVTSVGLDQDLAQEGVRAMYGSHRIPDMLKKVDLLCRGKLDNV